MGPILTPADLDAHAIALAEIDPAFLPVIAKAGTVPMRHSEPGFRGMAQIIVAQMVSRAATAAIWGRLEALVGTVTPEAIASQSTEALRAVGLSGAKEASLRALAEACIAGLDLHAIAFRPPAVALGELKAIRGVGQWTAEVYLLFSAGHPDIFPHGDVALQNAAAHAFSLEERPVGKRFQAMTARWAPHRSMAARLLWAYYAREMRREATPVG
jgi:DNA-3-methyladenine glycosylase II